MRAAPPLASTPKGGTTLGLTRLRGRDVTRGLTRVGDEPPGLSEHTVLVRLAVEKLREFIDEPDPNLKYLGLQALQELRVSHPRAVTEHKETIFACLQVRRGTAGETTRNALQPGDPTGRAGARKRGSGLARCDFGSREVHRVAAGRERNIYARLPPSVSAC